MLLVFAAAWPTISMLFTLLSWGASFFEKLGKYQKNTSKKHVKWYQNPCKITSKIYQKTMPEKRAKKQQKWAENISKRRSENTPKFRKSTPRRSQNVPGTSREPQRTPKAPHSSQKYLQRPQKVIPRSPKWPSKGSQRRPQETQRPPKATQKGSQNDTSKEVKILNRKSMQRTR